MSPNTQQPIIINGRFLGRTSTGVDRFAFEILNALDNLIANNAEQTSGYSFSLAVPSDGVDTSPFKNIPIIYRGKTKGILWEQFELPLTTSGTHLINLCNAAPLFKHKQMVVIHDATPVRFPGTFSTGFRLWYRLMMPLIGNLSKQVCTVSQFSKSEIAKCYGISESRIGVISESGEHILRFADDERILEKYALRDKPYMLSVSSLAPHKNFKLIFEALNHIENPQFDVVIAGGANPQVFASASITIPEYVKHVGYVSDSELKSLMSNAKWFIFPSIYEGFGIPPLEAMSCGCPVLSAKAASLPEVCGDAALYFNPADAVALADLLMDASTNSAIREQYKLKGKERAASFTWEQAALQLLINLGG